MSKVVCVISVHPDDETLGAGGTILKHSSLGDEVHCIFCTNIFESEGFPTEVIQKRQREIQTISALYDFAQTHFLNLKTMQVDTYPRALLVSKFSEIFQKIRPNILYLPFAYDAHSDHRVIFESAFSCTKSFRYPSIEKVLMMEVLSETDFAPSLAPQSFIPNVFVDISHFINQKCEIMKIYASEIAPPPFPRSIENIKSLALLRGSAMGNAIVDPMEAGENSTPVYAEAFMLLRENIR